jgi:hypothetical protein
VDKPDGQMTVSTWTSFNLASYYDFFAKGTGPLADNYLGVNGVLHTPSKKNQKRPGMNSHKKIFYRFLVGFFIPGEYHFGDKCQL